MIARLLAVLVLLLQPLAAQASVMIVADGPSVSAQDATVTSAVRHHNISYLTRILDAFGVTYKVVPPTVAKTEFCRIGTMTWNYGTAGAYTESFDAVIHLMFNARSAGAYSAYRPDSLTLVSKAPTVPQLMVFDEETYASGSPLYADAAACTIGVSSNDVTPASAWGPNGYYAPGHSERVMNSSISAGMIRNSTAPAGGIRIHVSGPHVTPMATTALQASHCASQCDSMAAAAAPDTMSIWERQMTHVSTAKPILFLWGHGGQYCFDSTYVTPCEMETPKWLMALARLDSLTGGSVFDNKDRLPLRMGLTIDGGFSRSGRRHHTGLYADDSTTLKATIDSLNTLGIPAVLGVNVDSVSTYPSEKGWWANWSKLKYSPQSRDGLDSTAATGNTSVTRTRDVWGRYRQRQAYQNSACTAAGDTSIYCLLKASFQRCDSIFGVSKVSSFVMPPDDDCIPKVNFNRSGGIDSILYAASLAGVDGIRIDGRPRRGTVANPIGSAVRFGGQRTYKAFGRPLTILAHSGYSISGGALVSDLRADSVAAVTIPDYQWQPVPAHELNRVWPAAVIGQFNDYDYNNVDKITSQGNTGDANWNDVNKWTSDKLLGASHRGQIVRLGVNDLAGPGYRPMWWAIKSITHAMRIMNRLAGRTIVTWDYPERITPVQ